MTIHSPIQRSVPDFDPDDFRMTIGDHLEELRRRLILALLGFVIVFFTCFAFGEPIMSWFCKPLYSALQKYDINPQLYFTQVADPFMTFLEICVIVAVSISAPWMVWQFWQFVAAGLYPNERKVITKHVPLSITLLITGMAFVYYPVLPWTLQFFLAFSISIPLPSNYSPDVHVATTQPIVIPLLEGDPAHPVAGQIWNNHLDGRVKIFLGDKVRVLAFGPENLMAPMITLPDYIDLVISMLLTFGLSFQLPLVIVAIVSVGIVDTAMLKAWRRYVYFAMAVLAAMIAPEVVTAMIALMLPLCVLYELGIWLARNKGPAEGQVAD
jgi:sec-independent protein translocase protein TatC